MEGLEPQRAVDERNPSAKCGGGNEDDEDRMKAGKEERSNFRFEHDFFSKDVHRCPEYIKTYSMFDYL